MREADPATEGGAVGPASERQAAAAIAVILPGSRILIAADSLTFPEGGGMGTGRLSLRPRTASARFPGTQGGSWSGFERSKAGIAGGDA